MDWRWVYQPRKQARRSYRRAKRAMHPKRVVKRVVFGANAPTWKQVRREVFVERQTASFVRDPRTGVVRAKGTKKSAGVVVMAPKQGRRVTSAKAQLQAAEQRRIAAAHRQMAAIHAQQAQAAAPMTQRVVRTKGGQFNGSKPAGGPDAPSAAQSRKARADAAAHVREVDARAARLLGWD